MRIVNLYAGPGTGKSTTAAATFAELKYRGVNCEYITEYAKDATWERRGPKVFLAQEYIFGKQHFKIARVADEVDYLVTDSPILLGLVYTPPDFYLPSLKYVLREAYDRYDNLDVFLLRSKAYNPSGRNQTEDEARVKDIEIKEMLMKQNISFSMINVSRETPNQIIQLMQAKGWPVPDA